MCWIFSVLFLVAGFTVLAVLGYGFSYVLEYLKAPEFDSIQERCIIGAVMLILFGIVLFMLGCGVYGIHSFICR